MMAINWPIPASSNPIALYKWALDLIKILAINVTGTGAGRTVATADVTLHVATTGNDTTGDGTLAKPFLTMQKAYDTFFGHYDMAGFVPRIQLENGSYSDGIAPKGGIIGAATIWLQGDPLDLSNVVLTNPFAIFCVEPGTNLSIDNLTLNPSGGGLVVQAFGTGVLINTYNIQIIGNMGTGSGAAFFAAGNDGQIILNGDPVNFNTLIGPYTADAVFESVYGGSIVFFTNIVLSGVNVQGVGFAKCDVVGFMSFPGGAFSGTGATGPRYNVNGNSVIQTFGSGATYFPGNAAGSVSNGGLYL